MKDTNDSDESKEKTMRNYYKYQGKPLSIRIAEHLILKLFAGVSNIKKEYITKGVIEYHKSQGGSDEQKTDPTHIACQALGKLKCYGYAKSIRHGYWNILVIYDNDESNKK